MTTIINTNGATFGARDSSGNFMIRLTDDSVFCNDDGNCMIKDSLMSYYGREHQIRNSSAFKTAEKKARALTDYRFQRSLEIAKEKAGIVAEEGVSILKDELAAARDNMSISANLGGFGLGMNFAENSVTCDADGNCML